MLRAAQLASWEVDQAATEVLRAEYFGRQDSERQQLLASLQDLWPPAGALSSIEQLQVSLTAAMAPPEGMKPAANLVPPPQKPKAKKQGPGQVRTAARTRLSACFKSPLTAFLHAVDQTYCPGALAM